MVGLDSKNLKPMWALEIKWSNRYFERPEDLRSLIQFCEKNKLNSALVTTIDKEGSFVYRNINLTFVPSAMYAYVVALNTIIQKGGRGQLPGQ